ENEQNLEEKIIEAQQSVQDTFNSGTKSDSGVIVAGMDNMLVRLSRCCNSVPYDDIVVSITKAHIVSVHSSNSPIIQPDEAQERFLEVKWRNGHSGNKEYNLDLEISGYDRHGLLNEVLQVVNETNTQISSVSGRADKNKIAHIHITVLIKN